MRFEECCLLSAPFFSPQFSPVVCVLILRPTLLRCPAAMNRKVRTGCIWRRVQLMVALSTVTIIIITINTETTHDVSLSILDIGDFFLRSGPLATMFIMRRCANKNTGSFKNIIYKMYLHIILLLYIYIYHHHHHHIVLAARISLTLSRHSSLSFIALGRSSGQHPVSSHSC